MAINNTAIVFCKNHIFAEDQQASNHPLLVADREGSYLLSFVCTEKHNKSLFSNAIEINYTAAGLLKPTVVICSKILKFPASAVTRIISYMPYRDYQRVVKEAVRCGGINNVLEYLMIR